MFNYLAKKKIKHQLGRVQSVRTSCFWDYRNTRCLILLYEYDQLPSLLPVIQQMQSDGIRVWSFAMNLIRDHQIEGTEHLPIDHLVQITRGHLTMNGQLVRSGMVREFLRHEADVIMDLSVQENLPFLHLISLSKAQMKMGMVKRSLNLYDFMISSEQPLSSFQLAENLLFYWKRIDIQNNNL